MFREVCHCKENNAGVTEWQAVNFANIILKMITNQKTNCDGSRNR